MDTDAVHAGGHHRHQLIIWQCCRLRSHGHVTSSLHDSSDECSRDFKCGHELQTSVASNNIMAASCEAVEL